MPYFRPVSPHLSVYKPQTSSLASIFNRITGSLLTLGLFLFLLFLSVFSLNWKICLYYLVNVFVLINFVSLTLLLFFSYHTVNSIRSLITWNLELKGIQCEKHSRIYLPYLSILTFLLFIL